jgi:hypothetical protein
MVRLYRLTLLFSILFALFILLPGVLGQEFAPYPLMKNSDVFDLLTPLVLIPLYWLLFELWPSNTTNRKETIVFLLLAVLWVDGHGMHLSANSIGHLLESMKGSDVYKLTYFYDESLSHYLWHLGVLGLSVLLLYRQWWHPFVGEQGGVAWGVAAGIFYGITFFLTTLEGNTLPMGIPFAAALTVWVLVRGRAHLKEQPLLFFFFVGHLVTLLALVSWFIYWGDLRTPCEAGLC